MNTGYWIVSSKHSRDETTADWGSKWTADSYFRLQRFTPYQRKFDFTEGDRCLIRLFTAQQMIGSFRIASEPKTDDEGDTYYQIDHLDEWSFPVDLKSLPWRYSSKFTRNQAVEIEQELYYELVGIKNFLQDLRLSYRHKLYVQVGEKELEDLLDSKNALRQLGLEIVDRQLEVTRGNRIDLLCKDQKGDLVVVELKRHGANETIGQLARYIADIREQRAHAGQKVSGLILALEIDEQLIKAGRAVDFEVILCQLAFG